MLTRVKGLDKITNDRQKVVLLFTHTDGKGNGRFSVKVEANKCEIDTGKYFFHTMHN